MTTEGMAPIGPAPDGSRAPLTTASSTAAPVAQQPQRSAKWVRWVGFVIGIIAIIRGGALLVSWLHPSMPSCDASKVQDTINDIYKDKGQLTVTAMTDVRTLSTLDGATTCQAHIVLSNGAKGPIGYTLSRDGSTIKVHITDAKDE